MSKTFKEIMETYGRIADVSFKKCKVENKNTYSDFLSFDNESIVSVNYGFDGALYSSVMRRMEAKLMGKQTDKIIKEDMLRDFVLSLTDSDLGDSASVNYGGFFVAEPPEYDVATDTTKLICYDEMYRAMTEYKLSLDWSNGITVKNFLIAVCNEIGVVLDADSLSNMANADTLIDGEKLKYNKKALIKCRQKVGIVFQDFKLLPTLTAYENVAFALECVGAKGSEIRPKVLKALERVGLKDKVRSFPKELSGGEQQRVCLARAIVNEPKLLICDEPTGNLDPQTSKEIMDVIDNINKELGTTVIMATHDKEIVDRMKRRVLVINNGMLVGDYKKGSYKASESN